MQHFEGTVNINASREVVWAFLMDPYKVGACMPGVESVEVGAGDRKFKAVAAIGFGSVKARFKGDAEFVALPAADGKGEAANPDALLNQSIAFSPGKGLE